uniref:Uncharacterized protein n=1 Tax=Arundo donax TaxID=35708 RepID=A0A0A9A8I6_ARUDO
MCEVASAPHPPSDGDNRVANSGNT